MITETRQSRTRLLLSYERRSHHRRRRHHHTSDNTILDKFNFICVPLRLDEERIDSSLSSRSNTTRTFSNDFSNSKSTDSSSPTRRVRFKCNHNDKTVGTSDNDQLPKKYSVYRVEFQIPAHKGGNPWLNVDCSSTPAKTRSITSQKIDINYANHNIIHPHSMTSCIDSVIPTTGDSDKMRTQWYKDMYCQIHKPPENKKDVIFVKLPPTPSRYREYYQQRDEQSNPYKPTYTFPEDFNGDLERMENYIRKTASQKIPDVQHHISSSPVRASTIHITDYQSIPKRNAEKITRFNDQLTSTITSSSTERVKSINDTPAPPITVNSRSNISQPIQTPSKLTKTDEEQRLIYKRVLQGGDIPSTGLQKRSNYNRVASSSIQRPLILPNHSQPSTKLFAYYSVHWEQNQTDQLNDIIDHDAHFEINSCLYFQTKNRDNDDDDDDDDDEWEHIREDGCGYVITYPSHIHPTDNLQIYNFDRQKNFLLTSNDVYLNSKNDYLYSIRIIR